MLIDIDPQTQQRLKLSPSEIIALCQQWHITELAVFGSILQDEFRVDSDIDILVKFAPSARQGLLTLSRIRHALETRIGRSIDLVPKPSIENSNNPIRRKSILQSAQVLYEQI